MKKRKWGLMSIGQIKRCMNCKYWKGDECEIFGYLIPKHCYEYQKKLNDKTIFRARKKKW